MAKYHINPRTGDPGLCRAKVNCPYGDLQRDHFGSKEEAREAYGAGRLTEAFTTLNRSAEAVVFGPEVSIEDEYFVASPQFGPEVSMGNEEMAIVEIPASELLHPKQIAHHVGDLLVSSRPVPSVQANGSISEITETMVISPDNDILYTVTTADEDSLAQEHEIALAWAGSHLRHNEGDVPPS